MRSRNSNWQQLCSSEASSQSGWPSHFLRPSTHWPLSHRNWPVGHSAHHPATVHTVAFICKQTLRFRR